MFRTPYNHLSLSIILTSIGETGDCQLVRAGLSRNVLPGVMSITGGAGRLTSYLLRDLHHPALYNIYSRLKTVEVFVESDNVFLSSSVAEQFFMFLSH